MGQPRLIELTRREFLASGWANLAQLTACADRSAAPGAQSRLPAPNCQAERPPPFAPLPKAFPASSDTRRGCRRPPSTAPPTRLPKSSLPPARGGRAAGPRRPSEGRRKRPVDRNRRPSSPFAEGIRERFRRPAPRPFPAVPPARRAQSAEFENAARTKGGRGARTGSTRGLDFACPARTPRSARSPHPSPRLAEGRGGGGRNGRGKPCWATRRHRLGPSLTSLRTPPPIGSASRGPPGLPTRRQGRKLHPRTRQPCIPTSSAACWR